MVAVINRAFPDRGGLAGRVLGDLKAAGLGPMSDDLLNPRPSVEYSRVTPWGQEVLSFIPLP